jgi:hypothetical protein
LCASLNSSFADGSGGSRFVSRVRVRTVVAMRREDIFELVK